MKRTIIPGQKFCPGQVVTTPGALQINQEEINEALKRHLTGDWGTVCAEDRGANEDALLSGGRLLSVYRAKNGTQFWIITETDRSVTTILLPEEY